ncbi:MAG: triose-phosphate isomerase [Thermoanaerobaculia bacterium]
MSEDAIVRSRRPLIGGNWKMNMLRQDAEAFCRSFASQLGPVASEVVLFPSPTLLSTVAACLADSEVKCGGQDLHAESKGAFTGDVSGAQLVDAGCEWVLCGHSERRRDHGEAPRLVGDKAKAAELNGLTALICVGETEAERRAGKTLHILEEQLNGALANRPDPFALAYEPVWAIGTGQTATPEIAQEAHRFLREVLADLIGAEAAAARRIVYGGSANPDNAAELIAQPDIDGFLVGGASLDPEKFSAIIRCCG